jgi:AAHS family 3-hydroxyphenylpropionic acid transporter
MLAGLAEGFDIQSMGVAAPTLAPALRLASAQLGPVFSASTLGLLIGAIVFGRLADRLGRRVTLILSLAIFGAFSLASASAFDFSSLLVVRLLAGLGLGGAMPNIVALSAEAAGEKNRARLVAIGASSLPLGGAVASLVAASLAWRAIFVVGGLFPIGVAAIMTAWLPESPALVASRRAVAAADGPADRAMSLPQALFGEGRAIATFLLWVAAAAALLSLFLILNWLPTLMMARGASRADAELIAVMFNVGGGLGALALGALFGGDRRAWVFAGWYLGMVVALVRLATSPPDVVSSGLAAMATGVFVSATPTGIYALVPDFYPVAIRGAGAGSVIGVGRIGAILGPFLAAALLGAGARASVALLSALPFMALSAAATFLVLLRRAPAEVANAPGQALPSGGRGG